MKGSHGKTDILVKFVNLAFFPVTPLYSYSRLVGPNRRYYGSLTTKTIENTASEADCCTKCGIWDSATTHISYNSNSGECACNDIDDGSSKNSNSNKFFGGSCSAPSGRKKRSLSYLSAYQSNESHGNGEKVINFRSKRNALQLAKSREMVCTLTGNAGYWKYDYTVPDRCYLVNCSLSDLQNIAINNNQVELDQPITTLYYDSAYK